MKKGFILSDKEILHSKDQVTVIPVIFHSSLNSEIENYLTTNNYTKKQKSLFFNQSILLFDKFLSKSYQKEKERIIPDPGVTVDQDFILSHFNLYGPKAKDNKTSKPTYIRCTSLSLDVMKRWDLFFIESGYSYKDFLSKFISLSANFKLSVSSGDILFSE